MFFQYNSQSIWCQIWRIIHSRGVGRKFLWRRGFILRFSMKQGIHPEYKEITATCSCGNVIKTRSTLGKDINLDVCGNCHPFYTGKQRVVDTGGRVERFNSRFKIPSTK